MRFLGTVLILLLLAGANLAFGDLKIRFLSNRDTGDSGGFSLYAMNSDGSDLMNLTNELGLGAGASWSPDRTKILFYSRRTGDREIFVVNSDGSNPVNLSNIPAKRDSNSRWSPDGRKILWESWPPPGPDRVFTEIFVIDADGSNKRKLADGYDPTWSPDGNMIAFAAFDVFFLDVFVMNSDGTGKRNISNDLAKNNRSPSWSPDGMKVAYYGVSDFNGHSGVYVVNVDGTGLLKLSEGFTHAEGTSWSPDGTQIAFFRGDIYVVNADGTNLVNLTGQHAPGWNGNPVWSRDGAAILFDTYRDGDREVYTMNADGSNPVNLTNHPATDCCGSWFRFDFSVLSTSVSPQDKLIATWGKIKAVASGQ